MAQLLLDINFLLAGWALANIVPTVAWWLWCLIKNH